ncbi:nicotinate-nucleotide adenylyltransferase [Acidimicrobiaceae bacterium]|nr:nicotinate-nucleotide adenylyltransferase [Acidimicrobiaceae bacterium]
MSKLQETRIGLFGGTFDPPHLGHLAAALAAYDQLELDLVLFVVANDPWQKTEAGIEVTPAQHRLEMVKVAVSDFDGLRADDSEINRGGLTYTSITLQEMKVVFPNSDLFLLVGGDVAAELDTWKDTDLIRDNTTLVVVDRPGYLGAEPPAGWKFKRVIAETPDIAGTEIRFRSRRGAEVKTMVSESVKSYIDEHGLYEEGNS